MDINFKDLMELSRKATMYDAIIAYVKTRDIYASKDDILAFAGELTPKEDSKEGTDNV